MGLTLSKPPPPDNGVYILIILALLVFIVNLKDKIEKKEKNTKTKIKSGFDRNNRSRISKRRNKILYGFYPKQRKI